jgi:lysophospholipase L1-like esterase
MIHSSTQGIRYIALGDSVSISLYPDLDATSRLGRRFNNLGAPELLTRNNDDLWPEFAGKDLTSRLSSVDFVNAAIDGGTLVDVNTSQLRLLKSRGADIVTLTVGGNDVLRILGQQSTLDGITRAIDALGNAYRETVARLRRAAPEALLIIATVYDPTDGTGNLPGWPAKLPIETLIPLNDVIREVVSADSNIALADVHRHFQGHGVSVPREQRWYWSESIIEPSMEGASEVRRLWLEVIGLV